MVSGTCKHHSAIRINSFHSQKFSWTTSFCISSNLVNGVITATHCRCILGAGQCVIITSLFLPATQS